MKCIKSVNQNKKEINYKMYVMKLIHVNIIKKGSNVGVRSPILSNFKKCTSIKTIKTSTAYLEFLVCNKNLACLSGCLFVCFKPTNVITAEKSGKHFCGNSRDPRKGL